MSGSAPLHDLVGMLEAAGLSYMVVGSIASTYWGPARTTRDIDVVVELTPDGLARLLGGVDRERYYVAEGAAETASRSGGQFNIIDLGSGWKFDVVARRDRPFSRAEFDRRRTVVIGGMSVSVASPEDTVLSKLEWAALGGSDRQVSDAASVLRVMSSSVDDEYLDRWAADLGITSLLVEARQLAQEP